MIDKRVKKAAPARKRPDRAQAEDMSDKPRRSPRAGAKSSRTKQQNAQPPRDDETGMRIAKVMARAGLCSRRDAETWIAEGRVFLNGKVLMSPAINIGPQDQVSVDGQPLAPRERTRLFLFHKPRGLVTTDKDPEGRQTIFDHLQRTWPDGPRVIAIGRLDINTEGLLLLTNDGGLARVLELPSTGWTRRYRVRANGKTDQAVLDRLRDGLTIDGMDYAGIEATLDRVQGDNVWLSLGLREGKNREIKRVLEHINLYVNRLIRVSFGPFQLGELAEGAVEEVRSRVLRDQLGPALAKDADADFESPIAEPQKDILTPQQQRGRTEARPREKATRDKRGQRKPETDRKPSRTQGNDDPPARGRARKPSPTAGGEMRRRDSREAPQPVEPSFKPRGPRKHISAMRSNGAEKIEQAERKRTVLSATADRKGRTVVVERKAKAAPRKPREEPARESYEDRKLKGKGTAKTQNAFGARGKPRTAAMAPEWQDSTQRPARSKGAAKKSAFKSVAAKDARPKGPGPGGARPHAARPAKPGRPQRPR